MQHTLIAVFDNRGDAQAARDELLAGGFSGAELRQNEGATTGIGAGAGAGNSNDDADAGFGAGIRHFFSELFGTEDHGQSGRYADAVARGNHVLSLTAQSEQEVERAADIVERHGPVDIDEESGGQFLSGGQSISGGAAMHAQSGTPGASQGGATGSSAASTSMGGAGQQGSMQRDQPGAHGDGKSEDTILPVIEEELRVGKRQVQRGGVRIFQRVVETPVSETVSLREEHVSVERRPVDQPVAAADLANFEEKSIELRETAEEPVVEKSARVVEEVVVGKQVTETRQEIADTVRRTEVDVEQLSGAAGAAGQGAGSAGTATPSGADMKGTTASMSGNGSNGMLGEDDNDYFRKHYDANYGTSGRSYQDYMPAYSYGSTMAANDSYRGRQWNDVEPALRQDWESRNPGSAWDNFKAAVRHGWDKITG